MSQVQVMRILTTACCMSALASESALAQTTAFYYGTDVPPELGAVYDQIVVDPSRVTDLAALSHMRAVAVAYFSLGEVGPGALDGVDSSWVLARNHAWGSAVMDPRHAGYRDYVVEQFERLWQAGYRRFFLDTLDSYQLASSEPAQREALRRALVELLQDMQQRHPEARWLLNRGFELLPDVGGSVHGVVAESLFDRWDATQRQYVRVPAHDRAWLTTRLREVRERYRLPIVVIDYRPSEQRDAARLTARKIADLGFQPWVCNAELSNLGVGPIEILPRRVLVLSDTAATHEPSTTARLLGPVLEYLGYVAEYRALRDGLPEVELVGRYRGIVTAFESPPASPAVGRWLARQTRAGMRVAMFGRLGFAPDDPVARELGIVPAAAAVPQSRAASAVVAHDDLLGFEADPAAHELEGTPIELTGSAIERHLQVRDRTGRIGTAIATTSWGGVALSHVFAVSGLHGERAWALDPFAFLQRALALPELPVPDLSTENGRHLTLLAVDPRGLGARAQLRGRPKARSVLQNHILDHRRWSHAVVLDPANSELTESDHAAALELIEGPNAYRLAGSPSMAGLPDAFGAQRSLTRMPALLVAESGASSLGFMATASAPGYYSDGAGVYLARRLIAHFEACDAPRRLQPIVLHYPGFVAASPGGLEALRNVYDWLEDHDVFVVRAGDYQARVEAFREQLSLRYLDGSYGFEDGPALRTVRVPAQLGLPDLDASLGVVSVRNLPQGVYVTFSAHGPRRLVLGQSQLHAPHIVRANGRVEFFEVDKTRPRALRISFHIIADAPLELEFGGLPSAARCELVLHGVRLRLNVSAQGGASVRLAASGTGQAQLLCRAAEAVP